MPERNDTQFFDTDCESERCLTDPYYNSSYMNQRSKVLNRTALDGELSCNRIIDQRCER